ncbi:unnamed protein product [Trichogramma brassicae]|uniref:RING-type domain-containing protein n=1 Tax=Trichogramma brassicae TaxID=86971 RepID=A0A6H5II51_9HYME|nr:unnamed protein product [Trichogramma brassicae]
MKMKRSNKLDVINSTVESYLKRRRYQDPEVLKKTDKDNCCSSEEMILNVTAECSAFRDNSFVFSAINNDVLAAEQAYQNASCGILSPSMSKLFAGFDTAEIRLWGIGDTVLTRPTLVKPSITLACDPEPTLMEIDEHEDETGAIIMRGHSDVIHDMRYIQEPEVLLTVSSDKDMRAWRLSDYTCAATYSITYTIIQFTKRTYSSPNSCFTKCHRPGHWIKDCPISNEVTEIKKSTGIPRSFMVPVEGPSVPGAMMTPGGTYAVPAIDHQAYKEGKKERPPFTGDPQTDVEQTEIPKDMICPICKDILTDAVMIPCCGKPFCDECIRTYLLESEDHQCPDCEEKRCFSRKHDT